MSPRLPFAGRRSGGGAARPDDAGAAPLLVLTDRRQAGRRGLLPTVAAAVEGGARAVVVREKDLSRPERAALVAALVALLDDVDGVVLVAGPDLELAKASGAAGVHLAASDPWPARGSEVIVGRSCHGADELAAAAGADYATVSPVFPSSSKPGYGPPLGTALLAALTASVPTPVLALGGVTAANAGACRSAGAAGVAVMGTVMAAADPTAATAELVAALAAADRPTASAPGR